MDAWVCRIKADPRARFLPCRPAHTRRWRGARGTCFRCRRWDRVHYRADRWLCDVCIKLVPGAATQSRSPRIRLFWQREPGKSLEHLHRHCLLEGPFIPQDLLSALAEAAGFGPVCWVERVRRGDLKLAGEGSTRGLGEYLSKTARTRVPSPLSRYFTKAAAEPDMFNALPKGVPRKRAPALPKEPSDWYVSAYRPAPPLAPAARDYWLLPERYLPSRAAPAARSPTVQVNMPFAVNTKILADLLVERDIKSNSKSNSQWLIEAGWSAKREGESSLEPPPGLRSPAPVRDAGALRVCPSPAGDTILSEPVSGALSCRERRAESAPPLHLILRRGNASRGRGPGP
jgi:hypothetical protein